MIQVFCLFFFIQSWTIKEKTQISNVQSCILKQICTTHDFERNTLTSQIISHYLKKMQKQKARKEFR